MLSTGGTIASVKSQDGLTPGETGQELIAMMGNVPYQITVKDILNLDSSNIQPEDWQLIAQKVYEYRNDYDGIVISHGTDTMAYTASMLTFMLQNINIPVALTGSQVPIETTLTDAPLNLKTAFAAAADCDPGVYIAYDRQVILGCRSVKIRTTSFESFASINASPVAKIDADGLVFLNRPKPVEGECQLNTKVDPHVALIKLFPGFDPQILRTLHDNGVHGFVIEAYGMGGMPFMHRDVASEIASLSREGVPVIAATQALYEKSDFTRYEVGQKVLAAGAISAHDMTSESAITKLMWGLGQGMNAQQIKQLFATNLAGEVTL